MRCPPARRSSWVNEPKRSNPVTKDAFFKAARSKDEFLNAIWNGKIEIVKAAVENGVDVNLVDFKSDGQPTALMLAFRGGREEIARYLISKKANVNGRDANGNTPLFFLTMFKDNVAMAKLLIENGADVNITNGFGNTALKFCPSDAVQVLKDAGAK
jgi:hypothetical protein